MCCATQDTTLSHILRERSGLSTAPVAFANNNDAVAAAPASSDGEERPSEEGWSPGSSDEGSYGGEYGDDCERGDYMGDY